MAIKALESCRKAELDRVSDAAVGIPHMFVSDLLVRHAPGELSADYDVAARTVACMSG